MADEKLSKLKSLLELSTFGMTKAEFLAEFKDEFLNSLKTVTEHVLKVESKMIERLDAAIKELKQNQDNQTRIEQKDFDRAVGKFEERVGGLLEEQRQGMNFIYDKIRSIESGKDGKDGKDADEERIVEEVLKKVTLPEQPELKIENIEGLKKELEDLRSIRTRGGGGGVSAMGVAQAFKYILKTEQPSGAINGSNTAYTVKFPIFAVLGFSLNGESIAQLPNYTISNKTITFSEAIPAAYSGNDFEIKYIST